MKAWFLLRRSLAWREDPEARNALYAVEEELKLPPYLLRKLRKKIDRRFKRHRALKSRTTEAGRCAG